VLQQASDRCVRSRLLVPPGKRCTAVSASTAGMLGEVTREKKWRKLRAETAGIIALALCVSLCKRGNMKKDYFAGELVGMWRTTASGEKRRVKKRSTRNREGERSCTRKGWKKTRHLGL